MTKLSPFDRNVIAITPAPEVPAQPVSVQPLTPSGRRQHQGANPGQGARRCGIGTEPTGREKPGSPDQDLWLSVIRQALEDATGKTATSRAADAARLRDEARHWFKANSADFRDVCFLAGLDPDAVRDRALKLFAIPAAPKPQRRRSPTRQRPQPARRLSALMRRLCASTALTPIAKVA